MSKFFSLFKNIKNKTATDNLEKNDTLAQKLVKKSFWLYFLTYVWAPAGYITRIIISNTLTVEEVGILYSIVSFIWILGIYNDLWMTQALKYFLPKLRIEKKFDQFKTSLIITIFSQVSTSIVIILFLWFGADWLVLKYFETPEAVNILKLFCFYFLGVNFFQIAQNIFLAFQDTFNNQFVNFVKLWATTLFSLIILVIWKSSLEYFSGAWILGLLFALLVSWYLVKTRYWDIIKKWKFSAEPKFIKKYLKYSLWTFLGANAGLLLWQIDQQMVIYFLGAENAGYFANYLSLFGMYGLIIWPIFALLFPVFTELITKKDSEKTWLLQNFLYTYMIFFSLILSFFFVFLWKEISVILFGSNYSISWNLLSLHWWFLFLSVIVQINFTMLSAYNKVKENLKIILITWILNVIMNYFFIKIRWITGVVIATIIDMFVMAFLSYKIINQIQKVKIDRKLLLKNFLIFLILWIITLLIKNELFQYNRIKSFLILWIFVVLVWVVILVLNKNKVKLFVQEVKKVL